MKSISTYDFDVRFKFLLSMAVKSFEDEKLKKNHLPFNSHFFIETINNKINSIVKKINKSNILFNDVIIISDIFILILKEDFPEYYKNYLYQFEYRNN